MLWNSSDTRINCLHFVTVGLHAHIKWAVPPSRARAVSVLRVIWVKAEAQDPSKSVRLLLS
jgi:hypothetical protein